MLFKRTRNNSPEMLSMLRTYVQELSSIVHIKELFKSLVKTLVQVSQAQNGSLWLLDEENKQLELRESVGGDPLFLQYRLSDPFVNYLGQTERLLTKHDLVKNPALIDVKESGLRFFTALSAEVVFPLVAEKRFIGALALGPQAGGKAWESELTQLLEILVIMASISIDNAVLYDSLAKQNLKLSDVAKLKTQFVSTITHELQTPLNGILGLSEILLDSEAGGPLNEDQKRYLQMIRSAGEELSDLVTQVIDLTRFQSQQGALEVKKIELKILIEALQQELAETLSERELILECSFPPSLYAYGDEGQIRQVFRVLLENAAKFSQAKSSSQRIIVEADKHGDMLQVSVSDEGIGLDEADQELIFEDFRQADGSHERSFGGTGLGLALARKILELHGGRIWVESKKGEGAKFFFTLPRKPALVQAEEIDTSRH